MPSSSSAPFENCVRIGSGSRHEGVRTDLHAATPWIANYARSSLLDQYEIFHLGIVSADAKYRVSRVQSPYTHFLACLSGEATLWSNGRRYRLEPGAACLLPKGSSHADQTSGKHPWRFCYVCYLDHGHEKGFRGLSDSVVAEYDPLSLRNIIETLRHECLRDSDVDCQRQLLGLAHHLVLRFASRHLPDDRLKHLWQRVAAAPAEDWHLDRLELVAHCHREHLRRLTRRHFGRSPVQQVTFIRMQHAATLLRSTTWTLQHIAGEVGYTDAFSFSAAFKHWFKICPTQYRANRD
jgi:AraC-like DNA-binding protein/quercetin dioxygenase-like cupin family protein